MVHSRYLKLAAVFLLLSASPSFAQSADIANLKMLVAAQQAQIAALQANMCKLTVAPGTSGCVSISCGSQTQQVCNGVAGINGALGAPGSNGAPGVNGTNGSTPKVDLSSCINTGWWCATKCPDEKPVVKEVFLGFSNQCDSGAGHGKDNPNISLTCCAIH